MKKGVVIAVIALVAIAAGAYWLSTRSTTREPATTASTGNTSTAPAKGADNASQDNNEGGEPPPEPPETAPVEPKPAPPPKNFCERDFTAVEAREADVPKLQAAGGLVHVFEREARLDDSYGCAAFYLEHGLDIDAVDPRRDHDKLTGLFFAIQRNDPKMLKFMIDHGAKLKNRASRKDIRALGYAYYLALNDTRIDRNEVIGILDSALTRQAAQSKSNTILQ